MHIEAARINSSDLCAALQGKAQSKLRDSTRLICEKYSSAECTSDLRDSSMKIPLICVNHTGTHKTCTDSEKKAHIYQNPRFISEKDYGARDLHRHSHKTDTHRGQKSHSTCKSKLDCQSAMPGDLKALHRHSPAGMNERIVMKHQLEEASPSSQ